MPYVNNDGKSYASSGVGTAALTTGIIGTAGLALGNGLLGNLFGGANQNPTASPVYQLAQKDMEIAQLRSQQYSDNKDAVISERLSKIDARVIALETAAPLRDKILSDSILNLQATLSRIAVPMVPNYALAPGYGPAMVAPGPFPFPPVVAPSTGGGTVTGTSSTSTTAAAA